MIPMPTSLSLPARLWIGKVIFGQGGSSVTRVSPERIIKGPCKATELEALEYVAKHTTIRIPKVYATYHYRGGLYIEMEYVHGENLQVACLEGRVSREERLVIVGQVSDYIRQLRGLKLLKHNDKKEGEEEFVGSTNFNECVDYRIGPEPVGPFRNHEEFHSFLRGQVSLTDCVKIFGERVADLHSRRYRSCFTHGDLCPRNIVVSVQEQEQENITKDSREKEKKRKTIVTIIDWENAGWYPEYWEYTKAHYGDVPLPDWYEEFGFGMADARYERELLAERALWQLFDQPAAHGH